MPPASIRPRVITSSGGKSIWPASDITQTYSVVSIERRGRKPKRSRRAPTFVPSEKSRAAGPSFFSSYKEKYSYISRMSGSISCLFSHAGGIIARTAVAISISSSITRRWRVWSSRAESDCPLGKMTFLFFCLAIASSDRRFFLSVFSSPLCAMRRKG